MNANESKHTPGPWYYDEGQVYTRYCDRPESGICDLRGSDNTQADGELIAQAPALLAERDALIAERDLLRAALESTRAYAHSALTHIQQPSGRLQAIADLRDALK